MLGASPIVPSPSSSNTLDLKSIKHPKTGTSVEDAVAKASLKLTESAHKVKPSESAHKVKLTESSRKYVDARSPDVSPVVSYIPKMAFEDLKTPNFSHNGPGLSIRLDASSKQTSPKSQSPTNSPRYVSEREPDPTHIQSEQEASYYDEEPQVRVIIVESNGDGTYSPKVEPQVRHDDDRFSHLNSNEKMKKLLETCREIRELATRHPNLQLDIIPDDGSVPLNEAYTYLEYARDTVGREDKMSLLELGIEAIYNFAAYAIERMFHIPMKDYFDGLKGRIRDYRNLLVQNVTISQAVDSLPSVVAPNTSVVTIISIFAGQLILGCVAAGAATYLGGSAIAAGAAKGTAAMASNQLNGFLFGDISLMSALTRIGGNIFKKNEVQASGPVDVA